MARLHPEVENALRNTGTYWPIISAKLTMFVDEMERSLKKRLAELNSVKPELLAALQSGGGVQVSGEEIDDLLKMDGLPALMRNAVLLILFGTLEHHIAGLCMRIYRTGAAPEAPPRRSYLPESGDYLSRVIGLNTAAFGPAWSFLDSVRKVRNCIAHEAAVVASDDNSPKAVEIREFIDRTPNIRLDGEVISLDAAFLTNMIHQMGEIFAGFKALASNRSTE